MGFYGKIGAGLNFYNLIKGRGGGGDGVRGVFYIFNVPREEGFNDFRWNLTEEEGGIKKTQF